MKYKNKKTKRDFVYTAIILHLYFLYFFEFKYNSSIHTSEFEKKLIISEIYFKYTSVFAYKYINLESLLQLYFRVSK